MRMGSSSAVLSPSSVAVASRACATWRVLAALAALLLAAPACEVHRQNWEDPEISAAERAKWITRYRKDAVHQLSLYTTSGYSNLEALEKAVEFERLTTQISPRGCPSCFREYGKALSIYGHHYRVIYENVLDELDTVTDPRERADLEDEARQYREVMEKAFNDSNRAYRTFFNDPQVPAIDPREYERVMRQYEYLGDFEMALRYLENTAAVVLSGVRDPAQRNELKRRTDLLRDFYKKRIQNQREQFYRRDQDLPDGSTPLTPDPSERDGSAPGRRTPRAQP